MAVILVVLGLVGGLAVALASVTDVHPAVPAVGLSFWALVLVVVIIDAGRVAKRDGSTRRRAAWARVREGLRFMRDFMP